MVQVYRHACLAFAIVLSVSAFTVFKQVPPNAANDFDVLIVGAGLSGTVMADLYARRHNLRVLMIDRRDHIAGNCFDYVDIETGILMNQYGAHLFHTSKEDVWRYVLRFGKWTPYEHRVVGRVDRKLVPIPVGIETVNVLLDKHITSVEDMETWIAEERRQAAAGTGEAQNSRDVGMQRVGEHLYKLIFHEYTKKQWNVYPEELGPEVLARIPVRTSWDDRYFPDDPYQALPSEGYTKWFESALDDSRITVVTGVDYYDLIRDGVLPKDNGSFKRVFFTGQIDQFLQNRGVSLPSLEYRSIRFDKEITKNPTAMQSAFVVNYPQFRDGNFTRIVEYKHTYHQRSDVTIAVKEFSTADGDPYYPFPNPRNKELFEQYKDKARQDERLNNVHFVGRLANYKYYNMDDAIAAALSFYEELEGKGSLSFIQDLPVVNLYEKMTVHIVVELTEARVETLASVCSAIAGSMHDRITIKWFFYDKTGQADAQRAHLLRLFEQEHTCPTPVDGESLFVFPLQNMGALPYTWLTYIFSASFNFGDINYFIRSDTHTDLNDLAAHTQTVYDRLFEADKIRASHPEVYNNDIQDTTSYLHQPELGNSKFAASSNDLHWISLNGTVLSNLVAAQTSDEIKVVYCSMFERLFKRESLNLDCRVSHPVALGGEFAVTDAGIRRMLAKHRTTLSEVYSVMANSKFPVESAALELMWLRLFRLR